MTALKKSNKTKSSKKPAMTPAPPVHQSIHQIETTITGTGGADGRSVISFSRKLGSPRTFSRKTLSVIVAAFGVIGVITVINSFAASKNLVSVQAENLVPDRWVGLPVNDGSAAKQRAFFLYSNATLNAANVDVPEVGNEIVVRAKAQNCNGHPEIQVKMDNQLVGKQTVKSTRYQEVSFKVAVTKGKHNLSVAYTNDYWKPWRCDRNIYIDEVTVRGAGAVTLPSPVTPAPKDSDRDGVVDPRDQCPQQAGSISNNGCPVSPPTNTVGVQSVSANEFLDTIGVNIHSTYTNTAYGRWDMVKQRLGELGVRHVRDGSIYGSKVLQDRLYELAPLGIKTSIIASKENVPQQLDVYQKAPANFISSIEGLNEPDCFLKKETSQWVQITQSSQKSLFEQIKARPALKNIPILNASYCRGETHQQVGDLSSWYDMGNMHPYPGGMPPEDRIAASMKDAGSLSGGKPYMATETGYHNALSYVGGAAPASERAAGIYAPRIYLSYFQTGVKRAFMYELVNIQPETQLNMALYLNDHFGMYRYNFAEKPAATAIRRLTTVLKDDPAAQARKDKLDYKVSGDTTNLQQMLVQKSNGKFYLVLWRKDSVWDIQYRRDLTPPSKPVTVSLPDNRSFNRFSINTADTALESGKSTASFDLGPDVQILEIQ